MSMLFKGLRRRLAFGERYDYLYTQEGTMPVVEWKKEGSIAIVYMNNGENRHNPDFAKGDRKSVV